MFASFHRHRVSHFVLLVVLSLINTYFFGRILCLLGGYILIGAVYRYYFLGIHSVEAIPNLEFWIGLPQRIKTVFVPVTRSHVSYSRDGLGTDAPVYH